MDNKAKNNWSWLPSAMPNVAVLMKEKRALYGDAHVDECWRHGVVLGEPGWFFAREGPLAVGTPPPGKNGNSMFEQVASLSPTLLLIAALPGFVEEVVDGVVQLVPVEEEIGDGAH